LNPDVALAVDTLAEKGVLAPATAERLSRVARRELVSVRFELRALLYGGVLLATAGIGLLLKEHAAEIGPVAISLGVGLAALLCLGFSFARGAPFSWGDAASPNVAFDYVLLLGALLLGSDLAFVEAQFRVFGPDWAYHLLLVAVVYGALAYRFDSKMLLSLALSSLAAWRGLAAKDPFGLLFDRRTAALRANAIALGALYLLLAWASERFEKKAHFSGVFSSLGLLLLFSGILSGVFEKGATAFGFGALLLAAAGATLVIAHRKRRPLEFGEAAVALFLGLIRVIWDVFPETAAFFFTSIGSLAFVIFLVAASRRMKEGR
jgi:hypothetical protein